VTPECSRRQQCEVAGHGTLVERVVYWSEGETLAYKISGMPSIVRSAESTWHLERRDPTSTRLTVTMIVETRFGVIGSLVGRLLLESKLSTALNEAIVQFADHAEFGRSLSSRVAEPPKPATV